MTIESNIKTMNCLDVCRELRTDWYTTNASIKNHLLSCENCCAYQKQQEKLNDELQYAINIDVPQNLVSGILLQQSINEKKQLGFRRNRTYAIAASLLLSVGILSGVLWFNTATTLQQVVLNHVINEQQHLLDDNNVQLANLNRLLQGFNLRLDSSLGKINYAGSCNIRGSKGVHLVVQTKTGPVTILLMPNEKLSNRETVRNSQFSGSVVPINNGSFAIIGGSQQSLSILEQRFSHGLNVI
ncbi:hypothetical protein MNBD_GAMMA22-2651 [hydrothermal vent metagenome]|uniref:DUF3379 domain-containing protein n=1 Tax=hydrothermal vent metagenome TaxID=652676 RepID=A0A3B0ZCL8_9ZZZZ